MDNVGVVGAGQMGAGIAQVSAAAGYQVFLADVDLAVAERGKANITKSLALLVDKEKLAAAERDEILERIEPILRISLGGYMALPEGALVTAPGLGDRAGPLGPIALASASLR